MINTHTRLAGGHQHAGIIGRCITVDGDAVERAVSQFAYPGLQKALRNRCIGGDKTEHGGHVRHNHARTFGDTRDRHCLTVELNLTGAPLRQSIRGHDAFGGTGPVTLIKVRQCCGDATVKGRHIQRLTNHPGRERQNLLRCNAGLFGQQRTTGIGVLIAFGACSGVGITGVDQQITRRSQFKMMTTDLNRCCTESVISEYTRCR